MIGEQFFHHTNDFFWRIFFPVEQLAGYFGVYRRPAADPAGRRAPVAQSPCLAAQDQTFRLSGALAARPCFADA